MDHEPAAVVVARTHDDPRRRAALGRGLGGRAHRRQRGRGHAQSTWPATDVDIMPGVVVGAGRGADPGGHHRRAPRHHVLPGAAQGQALAPRQRDDPREGADARAHALRRLGVLRQAHARAPRGVEPAAVAGHAHLGPVPERDCHHQLRGAAGRLLALGRGRARRSAACRRSSPRPSSPATPSGCSAGARPRRACRPISRPRIAREDHAKEVKLFDLGDLFLGRYKAIYEGLYEKDRNLTVRREAWGFAFTLVSIAALYSAYAWCAVEAVRGLITLGEMTMYIMLFRQGQAAVTASLGAIGGMYEDNLYLSTLYEYLEQPVDASTRHRRQRPGSGRRRAVRRRRVPLSGLATRSRSPASTCRSSAARAWRWSARTARARPR